MAKQTKIGTVISNKMTNTVVVRVQSQVAHPLYKKLVKKFKKFHVHTEDKVEIGKIVKIESTKPISKLKRWKVVEVIEKKGGNQTVR
ncbi:MAG TPA: 30S ribosomal protein S17 [Patescibacteria group bacterium]